MRFLVLQKRSEIIATYALCGFANLSSIGVQLGGIGTMAPARRSDLARLVVRALFAGTITTLMTGALAGKLSSPSRPHLQRRIIGYRQCPSPLLRHAYRGRRDHLLRRDQLHSRHQLYPIRS